MAEVARLSPLGQWVYKIGTSYPWLVDTTINSRDVPPEPTQSFLLGSRYADFAISILVAVLMPIVRGFLRRNIYEPIGRRTLTIMQKRTDKRKSPEEEAEWVRKWNESSWKLIIYTVLSVLAFTVSYREVWLMDSRFWWLGCINFPPCNLNVSHGTLAFYCLETGYYLQAIHFLVFHEVRRKDWSQSFTHHIATFILLTYSYAVNFTRVGVVVLLIHDISDIFMEAAKLCKYSGREGYSTFFFALFFVSWVVLRCLIFPLYVIRSTLFEPVVLVAAPMGIEPRPHWEIFNGLLMVLFVLHVYWTYLIFLVLKRVLKGNIGDVREDDD